MAAAAPPHGLEEAGMGLEVRIAVHFDDIWPVFRVDADICARIALAASRAPGSQRCLLNLFGQPLAHRRWTEHRRLVIREGGLLISTSWAIVLAAVVAPTLGMALQEKRP